MLAMWIFVSADFRFNPTALMAGSTESVLDYDQKG